ncbi:MAG: rod shape-determining protein RodA [bacterium]|nr:rod shape-determining protein RodA [bacterium]
MFFSKFWHFVKSFDLILLFSVAIIGSFGLAALYSIGLGKDPQNFFYLEKQAIFFALGFGALLVVSILNYRLIKNFSIPLYIFSCGSLAAVLLLGTTVRGTRGWLLAGTFTFQPVEFVKIALVLALAHYFGRHAWHLSQLRHLVVSGLITAVPTGLVLLQPDFGSAVVLFSIWVGMVLMNGVSKKYVIGLIVVGIVLFTSAWFFMFKDYQKDRIRTFIAPTVDQSGRGYNVKQAMIAIGSGQLFGKGIGSGSQSHLKFLPENQTDFIFSVIAEEMGLVGISLLLFFWILFFKRCAHAMKRARDDFAVHTVLGFTCMFLAHIIINIGGNLGLVPVTGIVLPFMSYGGSALVSALMAVGIIQSISIHSV